MTLSVERKRFAQIRKRCRANVTKKVLKTYFENFEQTLEGVDPINIVNYDEINLTDDPAKQKVLCRRGSKRVDNIFESSKSSTSFVMAITGAEQYISSINPFTYIQRDATMCNRTNSSWFDGPTFQDWFDRILLPYFRNKEKKVLIEDNLASHTSMHVFECCQDYNIQFILVPPNATHLLQPQDVAYFAQKKKQWRKILLEWKMRNRGYYVKSEFPKLLKKLLAALKIRKIILNRGFKLAALPHLTLMQF